MNRVIRLILLVAYYGLAVYLPCSYRRFNLGAKWLRKTLCGMLFKSMGKNVNIERKAFFGDGSQIEIGDNSGIGIGCKIYGPVKIGNNVMMAPEVVILTANHKFDRLDIPMCQQGRLKSEPVIIEDDVWIGTRAIILPGVRVASGSVIGAGAVVSRNVDKYAVVGGNPAKTIKYRDKNIQ